MDSETAEKLAGRRLLAAAARHDVVGLRNLLKLSSAKVQDDETGYTPLHAAIAASGMVTGKASEADRKAVEYLTGAGASESTGAAAPAESADKDATETVQLLFENGAIWNDLDKNDETPGCIAYRIGNPKVYDMIVAAGVRAELLLSKLSQLGMGDDDDDDDEEDEAEEVEEGAAKAAAAAAAAAAAEAKEQHPPADDYIDHWDSNAEFLRSSLRYTDTQLLDASQNAVMMEWERGLMTRHAETLLPRRGLRAMNIGHGMGIVDTAIQQHEPAEHHIVEAHPAVLARLKETGWLDKPGVRVHHGRWQDVLPRLVAEGVELDAVYYDTFAESYEDLRELFEEYVVGLLAQDGRFGFYHGLGADRRVCYDVYTKVVEIDLREAGFSTEWEELEVPTVDWNGVRRPYWNVDVYRLPVCRFLTGA